MTGSASPERWACLAGVCDYGAFKSPSLHLAPHHHPQLRLKARFRAEVKEAPPMSVAGGLHPSAQTVPEIRADSVLWVPMMATPIAQKRRPLSHRPRVWQTPPGAVGRGHSPPRGGPVRGLVATLPGSCSQEPGKHWIGGGGGAGVRAPRNQSVTLERDLEVPANRHATGKGRGQEGPFLCVHSHSLSLAGGLVARAGHIGGLSCPLATARAQVGLEQVCSPGLNPTPRPSSTCKEVLAGHTRPHPLRGRALSETPRGWRRPECPPRGLWPGGPVCPPQPLPCRTLTETGMSPG